MIWFSFKGVRSDEYGLLERLPLDVRAERITSYVEIPGGMPVAYETTGYKSQIITLNLGIKDVSPENLDAIDAWLFGEGELVFSNDPNRYYLAVCNKALTGSRIIKELGKSEDLITYVTDRKGHDMRYAIDPAKIHRELGWLPETKFADGIKKTIKWYLENREWWENILNGEYKDYYEKMYGNR